MATTSASMKSSTLTKTAVGSAVPTSLVGLIVGLALSSPPGYAPSAHAQPSSCPTFASTASRIGGATTDVAVAKGIAYVAVESRIRIVPLEPTSDERPAAHPPAVLNPAAEIELPSEIVALRGDDERDLLVAATEAGAVHVYRTAGHSLRPLAAATISDEAPEIALWAGRIHAHARLGARRSLRVIELVEGDDGTPPRLVQVGRLDRPPSGPYFAQDGTLYSDGRLQPGRERGLVALDIRDPAAPRVVGGVAIEAGAKGMAFGDGVAYVATFGSGPVVLDMADHWQPERIGVIESPRVGLQDVALAGTQLYGASNGSLFTYDLTDPRSPAEASIDSRFSQIRALALDATWPVVAADGLLEVLEGDSPEAGGVFGRYLHFARAGFGSHLSLALWEGRLYAESLGRTLHVLDLSDPSSPREADTLHLGRSMSILDLDLAPGAPGTLWASRSNGFVGDLLAFAAPAEGAPEPLSWTSLRGAPGPPAVLGERLFLSLTLSDLPTSNPAEGLRLAVYEVADPSQPTPLEDIRPPGSILAFHGTVGYHALGGEIRPVELTDPSAPVFGEPFVQLASVRSARVVGTQLFVSTEQGLERFDLTDPMAPRREPRLPVRGFTLAHDGTCLYVAQDPRVEPRNRALVHVLEVSGTGAPRHVSSLHIEGANHFERFHGMQVANGHLHAAVPELYTLALDRIVATPTAMPSPPPLATIPARPTGVATPSPISPNLDVVTRIALPWASR